MVAQIYGVGLITARLTGLSFEVGVFVGLAGILVCSFLGGMRAVTWTQVAQYIILIIAYMIPVVWLSMKHTNIPLPQAGVRLGARKVSAREDQLLKDQKEPRFASCLPIAPLPRKPNSRRCRAHLTVARPRCKGTR